MEVSVDPIEQGGGESVDTGTPAQDSGNPSPEGMAAIEAKFDEVFGKGDAQAEAQAAVEAENADAETLEAEQGDDKPAADDAEAEDEIEEVKPDAKGKKAPAAAGKTATLSPIHKAAAKANGWTDEDIDDIYAANPAAAERMFERMHTQTVEQYRALAATGQQALGTNGATNTAPAPAQPAAAQGATSQPPANALEALFTDKALAEFAENNGEELVEKFLKPFRDQVYRPVMQMREHFERQQQDALKAEVENTFKGLDDVAGVELYGKGTAITPEQLENRRKVAMLADAIAAGASRQGRSLSVQEALDAGHKMFSHDKRAEIERKALLGKVQRRSASITSRPTQRKTQRTVADGAGKGDAAAIEAYAALAAERGLEV